MKQNLRTLNEIVIHEVEEPLSSEKSSKFEDEKSIKFEHEKISNFEEEKILKFGDEIAFENVSVDMTVVGHKFNDAIDGPCFCVKSPKIKIPKNGSTPIFSSIPKSVSTPILSQVPAKQIRSDQCTSTSDLFDRKLDFGEETEIGEENEIGDDLVDDDDDGADTYSCSSVSSRSSRDPRCPRCFIIANTDCSKAVYV